MTPQRGGSLYMLRFGPTRLISSTEIFTISPVPPLLFIAGRHRLACLAPAPKNEAPVQGVRGRVMDRGPASGLPAHRQCERAALPMVPPGADKFAPLDCTPIGF